MEKPKAKSIRVRIAPSPTGNCHVGTARNALYNLLFARQHGGAFILRIDDTDVKRSTFEAEQGVLEGLRWLGLHWDEGPDVGGDSGPYRQSERIELYQASARNLLENGRAYHCFCTPEELEAERQATIAAGQPYRYSGRCRTLSDAERKARFSAGQRPVVRLAIQPRPMGYTDLIQDHIEQDAALLSDPVILKADGMPTYSFATVVDEHSMHISHVLRSAEHINNTFPQLQMYEALGVEPPQFGHFGLLLNPDRSKISKRAGAVYIGEFRDMGYLPEATINHLALSGWNSGTEQEVFSFDELLDAFSLDRCGRANAIFDRPKLLWLNGIYIRNLSAEDLARRVTPFLVGAGLLKARLEAEEFERLKGIATLEQERLKTLAEAPEVCQFFFRDPDPTACVALLKTNRYAKRHTLSELRQALTGALDVLRVVAGWTADALHDALNTQVAHLNWTRGEFLMPLRIAVSGREATPSLFETLAYIGRAAALRRLETVIARLGSVDISVV